MKKNYYSIAVAAMLVSIVTFIGCEKNDDTTSSNATQNQTVDNSTSLNKDEPVIHWDYLNTDWENEGFPDCGGTQQSPVNIITCHVAHDATLTPLVTSYTNSSALNELDNGHTLQVVSTNPNSITVNGSTFNLLQLHFHEGSEHEINGVQFPMEIHFVNQNSATNQITVIGVMVKEGAANTEINKIFNHWPPAIDTQVATGLNVNLNKLLPANKKYYTYAGSLTTHPCSEGLQWLVLKSFITMSHAQIQQFVGHYDNNFRPVQALNGRVIRQQ